MPPDPFTPLNVLVVEDGADTRDSLLLLLRLWGHDARGAADGPAALAAVAGWLPDLALIDIGLSGSNGCEVARRLRSLPGLAAARMYAATGYNMDPAVAAAAGFDGIMLKPLDLDHLERIVGSCPRAASGHSPDGRN